LVVDDDSDILRLAETILTAKGYDVLISRGSESAISSFTRMIKKPDLILTDVVMPGMSGPMLVDRLMAITPDQRVLFMSGYDERQVVQRYVVEKGFDLLPKPFTPAQLTDAVRMALNKPRSRRVGGDPA
jgi:two-component system, cell cycle sensor histidine kinase and response regulator CckA